MATDPLTNTEQLAEDIAFTINRHTGGSISDEVLDALVQELAGDFLVLHAEIARLRRLPKRAPAKAAVSAPLEER